VLTWLSIAAAALVLFPCRSLLRRFSTDAIHVLMEKRRGSSLVVSRGDFIDSDRRIDVAMALTGQTLFYENKDMEASLDLQWVSEIEYDTCDRTGASSGDGRVLRLRCYSRCFEFVVPAQALPRWQAILPARAGAPAAGEKTIPAAVMV
jgi:hypothetical protein